MWLELPRQHNKDSVNKSLFECAIKKKKESANKENYSLIYEFTPKSYNIAPKNSPLKVHDFAPKNTQIRP